MSELELLETFRLKAALELVRGYLVDKRSHAVDNLIALPGQYGQATVEGRLLFGALSTAACKTIARSVLTQLLDAGECTTKAEGEVETSHFTKSPAYVFEHASELRTARVGVKAAIVASIEKGSRRIAELEEVSDNFLRSTLKTLIRPDGVSDAFLFALFRREIDALVENGTCDRSLTPHEGEQVEVITKREDAETPQRQKMGRATTKQVKHEDGEKPQRHKNKMATTEQQKAAVAVTTAAANDELTKDGPLSAQDRENYRRAFGIRSPARKHQRSSKAATPQK